MTKAMLVPLTALALLVAPLCALAPAQSPGAPQAGNMPMQSPSPTTNAPAVRRTIEVSGNGQVQVAPDMATVEIAIETSAPTAAEAAGANGALAQKVRDAIRSKLGDKGTMWTGGYSLFPDYNQQPNGAKPTIVGYRAENSITVQTGQLDVVGPVIDAAIAAGANRVNSLSYSLRNDSKARGDAIAKAARDAQVRAQALAGALGVRLGAVLKASTESEIRPMPLMTARFSALASAAPTPIEAGQVTVPATVSLTYAIQ